MARFSVGVGVGEGGEEDSGEGPSSPRPKRPRQQLLPLSGFSFLQDEGEGEGEGEDEGEDEEEQVMVSEEESSEQVIGGCNGEDGSISVTLTDPDVLDCPICLEPLSIPVFQCENGHVACSCCCGKIRNKCPSCSLPIGYNRCRAIEKVLESIKVLCRNTMYGCKETVNYNKKHHHEKACIYSPCSCPLPNCDFVGSSEGLYRHFSSEHSNSATPFCFDKTFSVSFETNQRCVILQELSSGIIFILNHAVDRLGSVVNVCCIGQSSSKKGFSYKLVARNGGSSVRLHYSTESISRWCVHIPHKAFLLVPADFVASPGQLTLQILIWNQDSAVYYGN